VHPRRRPPLTTAHGIPYGAQPRGGAREAHARPPHGAHWQGGALPARVRSPYGGHRRWRTRIAAHGIRTAASGGAEPPRPALGCRTGGEWRGRGRGCVRPPWGALPHTPAARQSARGGTRVPPVRLSAAGRAGVRPAAVCGSAVSVEVALAAYVCRAVMSGSGGRVPAPARWSVAGRSANGWHWPRTARQAVPGWPRTVLVRRSVAGGASRRSRAAARSLYGTAISGGGERGGAPAVAGIGGQGGVRCRMCLPYGIERVGEGRAAPAWRVVAGAELARSALRSPYGGRGGARRVRHGGQRGRARMARRSVAGRAVRVVWTCGGVRCGGGGFGGGGGGLCGGGGPWFLLPNG
jgi:hypothetical protein